LDFVNIKHLGMIEVRLHKMVEVYRHLNFEKVDIRRQIIGNILHNYLIFFYILNFFDKIIRIRELLFMENCPWFVPKEYINIRSVHPFEKDWKLTFFLFEIKT
jgi:hypothetical protein